MYKPYQITDRQRDNARRLGVEIRLSVNPNKKLDVFDKSGKRIAQIGAKGTPTTTCTCGSAGASTRTSAGPYTRSGTPKTGK